MTTGARCGADECAIEPFTLIKKVKVILMRACWVVPVNDRRLKKPKSLDVRFHPLIRRPQHGIELFLLLFFALSFSTVTPTLCKEDLKEQVKPLMKAVEDIDFDIVKPGETLMMITRTFDCDLSRLIKVNDLAPPNYVIQPGQEIKLIGCKK